MTKNHPDISMGACRKKWKGQDTLAGERGLFFSTSKEPSQTDHCFLPSHIQFWWPHVREQALPSISMVQCYLSPFTMHELIFVCSYIKSLQGKMDVFKVHWTCESFHFPSEYFFYIPWKPLTSWLSPKKLSIPLRFLRIHIALLTFLLSRLKSLPKVCF